MRQVMVTTTDNPFNYFIQFDLWNAFDIQKGYYTCAFLDRITKSSNELSEADEHVAIENAIDEIVEHNVLGKYMKVSMTDEEILSLIKEGQSGE